MHTYTDIRGNKNTIQYYFSSIRMSKEAMQVLSNDQII